MTTTPHDPEAAGDPAPIIATFEADFVRLLRDLILASPDTIPPVGISASINKAIGALKKHYAPPSPKSPRHTREYSADFDVAWMIYPHPPGDSKSDAFRCYVARRMDGHSADDIHAGIMAYRAYCEAQGWCKTKFCKQGATFFGPGLHFLSDWSYASIATPTRRLTPAEQTQANISGMFGAVPV